MTSDSAFRHLLSGFALAAAICLSAVPLLAQEDGEEPPPEHFFVGKVGVEVVSIDVVVVDRSGRPLQGLGRGDFELRIDGRPVEIANFYAVDRDAPARQAPQLPEPAVSAEEPGAESTVEVRHVAVFLDNFYLSHGGRKRLFRDLPDFFDQQLAAGAEIMIAFNDRGLEILTPFTTEREKLTAALEKAAAAPASGNQHARNYSQTLRSILDAYKICEDNPHLDPCGDCWSMMVEPVRVYSFEVQGQRHGSLAALANLTSALSLLEGRKILLYAADGMQLQPGVDLFHFLGEICPQKAQSSEITSPQMRMDGLGDFRRLTAHANASRVTFYTLETAGLRNFSSVSAELGSVGFEGGLLKPSALNDQIRFANLQSTLFMLADDTGGKALLNANQFAEPLAQIHDEIGSFYSLGFSPDHPGAGETHHVVVKVHGKKGDVRYRRSFKHKDVEQQLAERTLGAFLLGAEQNPLAAEVRPGTPEPGEEGRLVVPIEVSVPYERLTLLPYEEERLGRLTLIVAAPEPNGKMTAIRKKELTIRAPLEEEATTGTLYKVGVKVELQPGHHNLAVALWDEVAAVGSYLSLEIDVASPAPSPWGK